MSRPRQLTLDEWDGRRAELLKAGLNEPPYGGILSRHVDEGDFRLRNIKYDNSPAALNLWNFLLTEEDRLRRARDEGDRIIGTMKDLGTVPVMVYSFSNLRAFYPDGAWWIPCVMELSAGLLSMADKMGIDESFCPVRAMLGAFESPDHFPEPDMLICSAGAICDDFSAIAQRLEAMDREILWWEIPHRRAPERNENRIELPGGFHAPASQVDFVRQQFEEILSKLESISGEKMNNDRLAAGIAAANSFRGKLAELRRLAFTADVCPLPALELLIAEMLALHFCSDRDEAMIVIDDLLETVRGRINRNEGYFGKDAVKVFWVNPVADLPVMNLLEECGGRICGTEYLFSHTLDPIPTGIDPLDALARSALADPMVGPAGDRALRISSDIERFGAEAVIISRIPGASHCALESGLIADKIHATSEIPTLEIEVPPVSDPLLPTIKTRIQGLIETVKGSRNT